MSMVEGSTRSSSSPAQDVKPKPKTRQAAINHKENFFCVIITKNIFLSFILCPSAISIGRRVNTGLRNAIPRCKTMAYTILPVTGSKCTRTSRDIPAASRETAGCQQIRKTVFGKRKLYFENIPAFVYHRPGKDNISPLQMQNFDRQSEISKRPAL